MTTNKFKFLKNDFGEQPSTDEVRTDDSPTSSDNKPTKNEPEREELKPTKLQESPPSEKSQERDEPSPQPVNKGGDRLGKRNDPNYKTVGILLPKKLHKQAKVLLMDDELERDFSELMTELLEQWLSENDS